LTNDVTITVYDGGVTIAASFAVEAALPAARDVAPFAVGAGIIWRRIFHGGGRVHHGDGRISVLLPILNRESSARGGAAVRGSPDGELLFTTADDQIWHFQNLQERTHQGPALSAVL